MQEYVLYVSTERTPLNIKKIRAPGSKNVISLHLPLILAYLFPLLPFILSFETI